MKFINNSNDLSFYLEKRVVANILIKDISIDTRSIKKGSLFIAINGDNFNGNDFVEEAFKKGASVAIVDDKKYIRSKDKRIIYVKNTILGLKKISKNIELVEGDIIKTLPKYVKKHPNMKISLLNLDVDLFEPTKIILENLFPKIVKGGIIILDDYNIFPGETKAVKEYFKDKKLVEFLKQDKQCDDSIDMVFNKKRANDRKTWLENYNRDDYLDTNLVSTLVDLKNMNYHLKYLLILSFYM